MSIRQKTSLGPPSYTWQYVYLTNEIYVWKIDTCFIITSRCEIPSSLISLQNCIHEYWANVREIHTRASAEAWEKRWSHQSHVQKARKSMEVTDNCIQWVFRNWVFILLWILKALGLILHKMKTIFIDQGNIFVCDNLGMQRDQKDKYLCHNNTTSLKMTISIMWERRPW